ncbi:hypothetical protein JCM3770_007265, partial [Rhodotorula araucariae]
MHVLLSLALYALVLVLSLRLLLPLFLSLVLLPANLRLSHVTPSSLCGIAYTHRHTGIDVRVARIRLARPDAAARKQGAWVALRLEGVRVRIPAALVSPPTPTPAHTPSPSPCTPLPSPPGARPRRPDALLLARLAPLVRRVALSADISLSLEGVLTLR